MVDFKQILPNWTLEINEISNNVYQFVAKNSLGNKSEITESDYHYGYKKCLEGAFDIELQLNNDNKFLYDIFLRLIDINTIKEHRYDHFAFGSWYIQSDQTMIVLDGRDYELRVDKFKNNDWISIYSISFRSKIKFENILTILDEYK